MVSQSIQTSPSLWTELLPLLPVIVGGIIGTVSSLSGGLILHFLKGRTDRLDRRAGKLEEFMGLAYKLHSLHTPISAVDGFKQRRAADRYTKAMSTIALIYIPEILPAAKQLWAASGAYFRTVTALETKAGGVIGAKIDPAELEPERDLVLNSLKRVMVDCQAIARNLRLVEGAQALKQSAFVLDVDAVTRQLEAARRTDAPQPQDEAGESIPVEPDSP